MFKILKILFLFLKYYFSFTYGFTISQFPTTSYSPTTDYPCSASGGSTFIEPTLTAAVSTQLPAVEQCLSGTNIQASDYSGGYSTMATCSGSPSPTHCFVRWLRNINYFDFLKSISQKITFICKASFASDGSQVTLGCSSHTSDTQNQCIPSATKLCSMYKSLNNKPLACYLGDLYESSSSGTSTFAQKYCMPIASGSTYILASYCKVIN